MHKMYIIKDIEAYFNICDLAKKNGKKVGDSMQEEFEVVSKEHPEYFEFVGDSELDIDMLAGELRDKGVKVLNMKEERRRNEREKI